MFAMIVDTKMQQGCLHSRFASIWGQTTNIKQLTHITPKTKNLQFYRDSVSFAMFDEIITQYMVYKTFLDAAKFK